MRICKLCNQELDESQFDRTGPKHYLRRQCRACILADMRTKYDAHQTATGARRFVAEVTFAEKTCTRCGVVKLREDFHFMKKGGTSRNSRCKPCVKAQTYEWRDKNKVAYNDLQKQFRKRHPDRVKASNEAWIKAHPEYYKGQTRVRMLDPEYRKKHKVAVKKWNRENVEKVKLCAMRRAARRLGGGPLPSDEVLHEIMAKPCKYCGKPGNELDHMIALARGGTNEASNLICACRLCNAKKGAKTPEEFKVYLEEIAALDSAKRMK